MVFCHNIPTFYQVGLELGEKNTLEMGMVAKDYLQLISGLFVHGNNLKMLWLLNRSASNAPLFYFYIDLFRFRF